MSTRNPRLNIIEISDLLNAYMKADLSAIGMKKCRTTDNPRPFSLQKSTSDETKTGPAIAARLFQNVMVPNV